MFSNRLAMSESGGDYSVVNSEGYAGKYQFGKDRLADYSRATGQPVTMEQFVADPALQERVQQWHVADIDSYIRENGLDRFIGQNVGGVPITLDGMRAMAHLGGKGGMAKFLATGGQYNPADSNGTSLLDYAKKLGGPSQASGGQNAFQPPEQMQSPMAPPRNALASIAPPQIAQTDVTPFLVQNQLSRL